jgi:DNA-binding SARP family transcriptional activator
MEATACVNLSSLYLQHGESTLAASMADDGLALAPEKAAAVQLRLRGNIAVTRTWVEDPTRSAKACLDLALEAEKLNLHHYAAIAHHNYGALVRDLGDKTGSLQALERARSFWEEALFSPFADNYEIALTLLSLGRIDDAEQHVRSGLRRTKPWPLPHAEAEFGLAHVMRARGQFDEAAALSRRLAALPTSEGALRENAYAFLIDALILGGSPTREISDAAALLDGVAKDPRNEATTIVAAAVGHHFGLQRCDGRCLRQVRTMEPIAARWPVAAALAKVKFAVLAIHHNRPQALASARDALGAVDSSDSWQQAKWWTRQLLPFVEELGVVDGMPELLMKAATTDPDGWRAVLPRLLNIVRGKQRAELLTTIVRLADRTTAGALASVGGSDVEEARRRLIRVQAPRLYIRTLGGLSIHRGGWDGPAQVLDKKRLRSLLGLLTINIDTGVPRDSVMDVLWPEADPAAALNNLNQALYKLRRFLDPEFRDGASPMYLHSDSETVRLDRELVRTDLAELRRLGLRLTQAVGEAEQKDAARAILRMARGELLPELRYEEWMAAKQMSIEEELRSLLLPLATGKHSAADPLLATRAAAVLVELDPFDESANLALATQLTVTGRRAAARAHLDRYAMLLRRELGDQPPPGVVVAMRQLGSPSNTT